MQGQTKPFHLTVFKLPHRTTGPSHWHFTLPHSASLSFFSAKSVDSASLYSRIDHNALSLLSGRNKRVYCLIAWDYDMLNWTESYSFSTLSTENLQEKNKKQKTKQTTTLFLQHLLIRPRQWSINVSLHLFLKADIQYYSWWYTLVLKHLFHRINNTCNKTALNLMRHYSMFTVVQWSALLWASCTGGRCSDAG